MRCASSAVIISPVRQSSWATPLPHSRARHERFFARAGKNQHAHTLIVTRVKQSMLQLFHRLAVQRIQHLRPIEGNVGNPIFLIIQNVLVSHLSPLFGSAFLGVLCSLSYLFFLGLKL